MKILIHTMYFLPEFGSAPILMNELAAYLAGRGHDVEVITTLPRPPHNRGYAGRFYMRECRNGFHVKRILTNFTVHHIGRLVAWSIYTMMTIIHLAKVRRGDVVFLRLPPLQLGVTGILARFLCGARVMLNVQDIHPDLSIESGLLKNPLAIKAALGFEKWIYDGHRNIVVISDGFKRNLTAKGVSPDKISVIPNWVDTEFVRPLPKANPVSEKHGLAGKFVLLYSGIVSISSYATLVRILETAALLKDDPEILFVIVGEGFKANDLQAKAAELDLPNVLRLPFQPYRDVPQMMASADVLLVPLDKEKSLLSVPSKFYNYAAAGRPVLGLAHENSEIFQIIRDARCGLCAPPDDPARIAAVIRALKKDADGRAAMGANGRAYALKNVAKDLVLKMFEDLMTTIT
jgi:colanic acid biosynthesis glycosyl transferase WcaI